MPSAHASLGRLLPLWFRPTCSHAPPLVHLASEDAHPDLHPCFGFLLPPSSSAIRFRLASAHL
eukprot:CAMPEP_0206235118 /NCGR_PEP_ID=MMETSP0047_2-20121206/12971_1 /ASSEMBLY_ACC=CAM_ASM_000192 /TAXON_ID=195065 /ORGANISM="Chroomonas mesostigmatica_cf, Strain CCMP1168" /LENGTH=62 /DNA_ID=CAMNT_0053659285 /DNA_START=140 /DNA_END=328 /DNA_ORIENTATION=+